MIDALLPVGGGEMTRSSIFHSLVIYGFFKAGATRHRKMRVVQ
jgi:hypothetical protein